MAADGDCRQRHVFAGIGCKDIADAVNFDRAAEGPALGDEPVAGLTILLGQCQSGDAAPVRSAEARGRNDVAPQPVAVRGRRVDAVGFAAQGFGAHFGCSGASLLSR
jgi:hypothetical protein